MVGRYLRHLTCGGYVIDCLVDKLVLCKVCKIGADQYLHAFDAGATEQHFESLGRREDIAQFHLGVGHIVLTMDPQVTLVVCI